MKLIQPSDYHKSVKVLRSFFESKGFVEVPVQSRLSILAACEDPTTVGSFTYSGQVWPLPQTGQMWLEYELLKNKYDRVFCQSTSYRQEPNPIEGRHDLIFPMFEFESVGDVNDLMDLEKQLLLFMGFHEEEFSGDWYSNMAEKYQVKELTALEEEKIWHDYGKAFFLQQFPEYTSPFWNMKRNVETGFANKVDVLMFGMETIGSAERETDTQIMSDRFHSISDGYYADLLYSQFGKDRVLKELGDFLSLEMKPRFGGGIGMTRFIRAHQLLELDHISELGRS